MTVTTPSQLILDAGQTGIRVSRRTSTESVELTFSGLKTNEDLFPQLAQVISDSLGEVAGSVNVCIGMTGLTLGNSRPDSLLALLSPSVESLFLAHDSITGFLGSLGLNHGVVTAVGTGVVTLGMGPGGMARVDGWGNILGDAGSAYWIGRAGLEAAMRSYDGRISPTALGTLLSDNFTSPEEAYIELQTDPNRVARIASFARTVIDLAETDDIARDVVVSAGRELALSARTAANRAGLMETEALRFSWTGNVMKSRLLRETFTSEVTSRIPNADIVPPLADPIDGVAMLESASTVSPFREAIHSARR
jgi:glucosamine kinase